LKPEKRKTAKVKRPSRHSPLALTDLLLTCQGVYQTLGYIRDHGLPNCIVDHRMIIAAIKEFGVEGNKHYDKSIHGRYVLLIRDKDDGAMGPFGYFVEAFFLRLRMMRYIRKYERQYMGYAAQLQSCVYS
jgi:hypothetical protein